MFSKRQNEIINAAVNLLATQGIQNLTIKNLSASLSITEGAIYRHFKSKHQILLGILKLFEEHENMIFNLATTYHESTINTIKMIFKKHFEYFTEHPQMAAIIFSEQIFQNNRELSQFIFSIMTHNQKFITSIIKKGQEENEIRSDIDTRHIATMLLGSIRLLVLKWHFNSYDFNLKTEGEKLIESILELIKK